MARVKRGLMSHKRHKNLFKLTRGYRGSRNNLLRMAKQAVLNAGIFAYRDRRNKKRAIHREWIVTINNALSQYEIKYSVFMHNLTVKGIVINRKVLADLATNSPEAFKQLVDKVR